MTGEITSASAMAEEVPGDLIAKAPHAPATMRAEWRALGAFLKRPRLPDARPAARHGLVGTLRLLVLDLMIMAVFIAVLMAIVAGGFELPDNLNASLEMNLETVLLIVLLAPLLEELVFRSWLSGRPRYLVMFPIALVAGVIAAMMGVNNTGDEAQIGVGLSLLGGIVVGLVAFALLWSRPTPAWFKSLFPGFFWLSSAAFALVHLFNYTEGALLVLLPLVVPQFVLGAFAAYARVQHGLVFAILLHALHNGFALSVAALGMAAEGG